VLAALVVALTSLASTSVAGAASGGAGFVPTPKISSLSCRTKCPQATAALTSGVVRVQTEGVVRVRGRSLRAARTVVFLGGPGAGDDVRRTPRRGTDQRLDVSVPRRARTGRILLLASAGIRSPRSKPVLAVEPPPGAAGTGFRWPIGGPVTSPFGQRWGRLHAGIDIGVPSGTNIRAAAGGTVIAAEWTSGYGNYTCVHHHFDAPVRGGTDYVTCYAHQSQFLVRKGEAVASGQVIGLSGCTGSCYGDHLHFEMRRGVGMWATPEDPIPHLPARAAALAGTAAGQRMGPPMDHLPER
jgi:murein DD-endopeptidase MepM/ murein hydrolase activator NlpD